MLPQMAVPAHQSLLSTISVLAVLLSLAHSAGGQSQLMGPPQPIVATVGGDIILPCHLEPAVDVAAKTLEWTRRDLNPRLVFVWRAGQDHENVKNPSYKRRTSLFTDKLKRGNISLKLSDVRPSDAGRYRCFIPDLKIDSFVELVVASGAVSSPVISLAGIDKTSSGVVLQCESAGWHPEPEVLWLDGEGKLLSAGPTETVRGPDDLYTVSSRVTVEKRHSNSFTCRVQQSNINQTTETHISVSDDFFKAQYSSAAPVVIGLTVSLALCILLLFAVVLFVWKQRRNKIKTKRSHRDETDKGEKKNGSETHRTEDQFVTEEEMKALKGKEEEKSKHEEQQRREEAEREVQTLKEELQTKKTEFESKLAEVQQQLQSLKEELETKNRELEENKSAQSKSLFPWKITTKQTFENEQQRREQAEKQVQDLRQKLYDKTKELQEEQQRREEADKRVKTLEEELKIKDDEVQMHRVLHAGQQNTTLSGKLSFKLKQPFQKHQSREEAEGKVQTLRRKSSFKTEDNQAEVQQLQDENQRMENNQQTLNQKDHNLTSPANQDSAKSHITVGEVNVRGKYVRLSNNSEKDQPMGDWELHIQVNKRKPIKYQFKHSFKFKARNTVTIWASDCGVSCETSTDLVWFGQKSWGTGEELLVTIYSNTGELEVRRMLVLPSSQSNPQQQQTHLVSQDSAMGNITVSDIDLKGSYVRLSNTSNKDQQLEGWELHIQVNDRKPIVYKFSHSFKLKAKNCVTIWSSDDPGRNNPPTDLVWQNQKSWGTGEELLFTIYSNTGEEMARKLETPSITAM